MGALRAALAALVLIVPAGSAQTLTIQADRAIVAPGRVVAPATIEIRAGRITAVREGTAGGAGALRATVVMAGLIDARTTAGLSGLVDALDDTDERGGPVRPELRAEDGFDIHDPLLDLALRSGTAIVHSGPGDANSIGGQAGVFLTAAPSVTDAIVHAPSAIVLSLTEQVKSAYGERNRLPGTRMANVALIRQAFIDAGRYARSRSPGPDAADATLARALADSLPAWIAARRSDEIATALRIAREFDIDVVITGATEAAPVAGLLAEASVPVVIEPTDVARGAEGDFTAAGAALALDGAGVPFALATGDARSGATLLEVAREAVRHGLPADAALAAITTRPAAFLGLGDGAGTLGPGAPAHLVLLDGDPFDARTTVQAVIVGGRVAWRRP